MRNLPTRDPEKYPEVYVRTGALLYVHTIPRTVAYNTPNMQVPRKNSQAQTPPLMTPLSYHTRRGDPSVQLFRLELTTTPPRPAPDLRYGGAHPVLALWQFLEMQVKPPSTHKVSLPALFPSLPLSLCREPTNTPEVLAVVATPAKHTLLLRVSLVGRMCLPCQTTCEELSPGTVGTVCPVCDTPARVCTAPASRTRAGVGARRGDRVLRACVWCSIWRPSSISYSLSLRPTRKRLAVKR